jgi:hypothetical protein
MHFHVIGDRVADIRGFLSLILTFVAYDVLEISSERLSLACTDTVIGLDPITLRLHASTPHCHFDPKYRR